MFLAGDWSVECVECSLFFFHRQALWMCQERPLGNWNVFASYTLPAKSRCLYTMWHRNQHMYKDNDNNERALQYKKFSHTDLLKIT